MITLLVDIVTLALVFNGLVFCLVAAIGLVRMPDLYNRMQSATKAGTLGVASIVLGSIVHLSATGSTTALVEGGLVILFFFGTAPLASHLIARAAYGVGVPMTRRTFRDDLKEAREAGAQPAPPASFARPGRPAEPAEAPVPPAEFSLRIERRSA